jgi:hypothetical protein
MTLSCELVDFQVVRDVTAILNEASLRNLFMKKVTRERVVPTISANVPWLIFSIPGSGWLSFPKLAGRRSTRARRFSLELKRWSTQIFLNPNVAGEHMVEHPLGKVGPVV